MEPGTPSQPIQPYSSQTPADSPLQKTPSHKRRTLALIVIVLVMLVGSLVTFLLTKTKTSEKNSTNAKTVSGPLMVGAQPFIYPCAVATRSAFATAFGLSTDVQNYGSMQETSTLLPSQIPATSPPTANLLKLIPPFTGSSVSVACSLEGIKSGIQNPTNIEVAIFEYPSLAAAQSSYSNLLASSNEGATTQPVSVGTLPDSNFLQPPDPSSSSQVVSLTFLHSNTTVELDYDPANGEQLSATTAELVTFAKSIGSNIDNTKMATTPTNFTGMATFVGKPLVDICRQADLLKIAQTLGSVQYRPDHVIDQSVYGSGQSVGSISDCEVEFNTPQDRTQNAQVQNSEVYFGRKATFRVSAYADSSTARTALHNQQIEDQKGTMINQLSGIGDTAYMVKQTYNNPSGGGTTVTTTYRIMQKNHVISIIFAQPNDTVTSTQVKQVYQQIDITLGT